jgi:small subunit ribosomal protein S1
LRAIPEKYIPGHIIRGKVAKLTNFGAFVELEPELEGLLHISELADHKIDKPQDIVKVGDEVEVKILKVDSDARKIGLSLRRVRWAEEEQAGEAGGAAAPRPHIPAGPEKVLSDADADQIRKLQLKFGEVQAPDAEQAPSDEQPAQEPEPEPEAEPAVAEAPEAEAEAEVTEEEAAKPDAAAEAPEQEAQQEQSEETPDTENTGDEAAGQEQEKD